MNSQRDRLKKGLTLALAALCALLLLTALWSLAALARYQGAQRRSVRGAVLAGGRAAVARIEHRPIPQRGESLDEALYGGRPPQGAAVKPRQAAILLGDHVLWSAPPFAPPPKTYAPPTGGDSVTASRGGLVYTRTFADRRRLVIVFDAPGFARVQAHFALAAAMVSAAGLALLTFLFWLGLKLVRSRRGVERVLVEAGEVLPSGPGGDSTQQLVALFQKTLAELRERTGELEAAHRRERQRAEDVEGMAEALCANLEAGYLRFDNEDRLVGVNAAARRLLGLTEVPRLGDTGMGLLGVRPEALAALQEVRQSRALALKEEVPGAPGTLLQVVGIPLYNLLHQLRGYLLILRDQTEVYTMQRTLVEREALTRLGEVAAGVAHEVRNSLNTMTAHLKLLEQDVPALLDERHFTGLREEAERLAQVVNNLLFFARPLPVVRETCRLADLLREEAEMAGHEWPEVSVEVDCPEDLTVEADWETLGRAIRNLARNALEASGASDDGSGRVRFSARSAEKRVTITVEDNGPGLDAEVRQNLFTPFTSQKPGGTGLGLAIARKIIREHGGGLEAVESELGGAGFAIVLPEAGD